MQRLPRRWAVASDSATWPTRPGASPSAWPRRPPPRSAPSHLRSVRATRAPSPALNPAAIEFAILLICAIVVGVTLHRTVLGRRLYAIGANPVAARFSGIEADRYRMALFVFAGLMAALAAVMLTGRVGSTRPNIAMGWELDAITMVILGGVAIEGGRGSIVGTMLAVLLLGLFTFAMGMANVTGIVMSMVIGALLIVSMVLPRLLKRQGAHA